MTDILRRSFAPITDEAWSEIDEEAARHLRTHLSARKIVDFSGPHGWTYSAVNAGRLEYDPAREVDGVGWAQREVLPLMEIRVPFSLNQFELDNVTRGSKDCDLAPLQEAAKKIARFEDNAIYSGFDDAGIVGVCKATVHKPVPLPKEVDGWPKAVAMAIENMHLAGIEGPYSLVLSPDHYHKLTQTTKTGYPLVRVVQSLLGGSIVWSEALEGGIVLSVRGGDFELTVGQDLAVGYLAHDKDEVELYFTESFVFRVLEPAATVVLRAK